MTTQRASFVTIERPGNRYSDGLTGGELSGTPAAGSGERSSLLTASGVEARRQAGVQKISKVSTSLQQERGGARTLKAPGPYEGMNITGSTGLSAAQKETLRALRVVEDSTFPSYTERL